MIWGQPPRYQITITLEPHLAHRHSDARTAAGRVAQAIESLGCDVPDFEETQLVEVKSLTIVRIPDDQENPS